MTRHDDASTYADLLARLGDDGIKELFRRLLQEALQELIDAELNAQIGADRHQRTEGRSNYRNGGRYLMLSTPAGMWSCGSPKCGSGAFSGSSHLSGDWRVRIRGGEGRLGQVTPPAWRRQRSR